MYDADGNQTQIESPLGELTTSTWDYENHIGDVRKTHYWDERRKDDREQIMAIEELTALVVPPESPSEVLAKPGWNAIERKLSVRLPSDYRREAQDAGGDSHSHVQASGAGGITKMRQPSGAQAQGIRQFSRGWARRNPMSP